MDIRKYEVFLAVVDKGSFIKAANELGYTQSGITHMMNSMEKECGFSLFIRSNKGVSLTLEGERVVPTIRHIVETNQSLEGQFDEIRGLKTGKVRVGCFPSVAGAVMPKLFRAFKDMYPDIQLDIAEEDDVRIHENWLMSGFIDVAFITKQSQQSYDWIPYRDDAYVVILHKDHPLAQRESIAPTDLIGENFFMFRSLDGVDKDVSSYFKSLGISIVPTFTSCSDYSTMFMISEGLGVSMQPKIIFDLCAPLHPNLVTVPLNPPAVRELGLAVKSLQACPPAVQRFLKCAKGVSRVLCKLI